ncbi:hypothetical protein PAECIP111890_02854 [Paenibacillus sp. JJ-223]|nr:hypothetical protein PAECIP111890_02854 [Paenibacillus sp. JJ-223]
MNFDSPFLQKRSQSVALPPCPEALLTYLHHHVCISWFRLTQALNVHNYKQKLALLQLFEPELNFPNLGCLRRTPGLLFRIGNRSLSRMKGRRQQLG